MISKKLKNKMDDVKDELALCLKEMMLDFLTRSHDECEYRDKISSALSL